MRGPYVFVVLAVLLSLAAACSDREHPASAAGAGAEPQHGHEENAIRLDPGQLAASGIAVVEVKPGMIDRGVQLLGEVRPNGDRLAHIVPRFPGIVRDVRKTIGDAVKSGETLAVIESSESLAPYELKTLLDGTIIEKHLTRGEAVDREKQAFVIADLSSLWIDLSIYQRDLDRITLGQTVHLRTGGDAQAQEAEGRISYITPAVDQLTRTATARVVLPNPKGQWRPGMFVTAEALAAVDVALAIPRTAVQTLEGRSVVFVRTPAGFTARAVMLGREGDQHVEVVAGLAAGEDIAATNTFLLKAELGKSEAEHED